MEWLLLDYIYEKLTLKNGYVELSARVNCINLKVSLHYAKALAEDIGFKICKSVVSYKKVPDGINLFGGQYGLVLKKLPK